MEFQPLRSGWHRLGGKSPRGAIWACCSVVCFVRVVFCGEFSLLPRLPCSHVFSLILGLELLHNCESHAVPTERSGNFFVGLPAYSMILWASSC